MGTVCILAFEMFKKVREFSTSGCVHLRGSRDGTVVRALASPPMSPGFDSRSRRHMWVEFVVGSRPCSEGFFPGSLVFLPPQNQHFQIPIRPGTHGYL